MKYYTVFFVTALVLPIFIYLLYLTYRQVLRNKRDSKKTNKLPSLLLIILTLGFFILSYARFVEPQIIRVNYTEIPLGFEARIVLISDIHLGVYKGKRFLQRTVNIINNLPDIDAVIIAGDLLYWPSEDIDDLTTLFEPLSGLRSPVFAVPGNHDSGRPGPIMTEKLKIAIEKTGSTMLHNEATKLFLSKGKDIGKESGSENRYINILGLGDRWAGEDLTNMIEHFTPADNLIVIVHNPDSTMDYINSTADLTLSGHAHGGQIRLPIIYRYAIPCEGSFDKGLYDLEHGGKLFISSGLGEVGLPMRLGISPVIDVLNLTR